MSAIIFSSFLLLLVLIYYCFFLSVEECDEKRLRWQTYTTCAMSVGVAASSLILFGLFLVIGPQPIVVLGFSMREALLWNAGLSLLFFLQHSGMVRKTVRSWLMQFTPETSLDALYSGKKYVSDFLQWRSNHHQSPRYNCRHFH